MKVLQLRCDSQTSFKVKRSKVRVTDGRGITVSAEPDGRTAFLECKRTHPMAYVLAFSQILITSNIWISVSGLESRITSVCVEEYR